MRTDSDEVSYTINPKSPFDSKTLEIYEFAGKVIGKAIFERISLDIHFDYCLLAALSGNEPTLEDLRTLDTPVSIYFWSRKEPLKQYNQIVIQFVVFY